MTGAFRSLVRSRSGLLGLALSAVVVAATLVSLVWTPYDPGAVDPRASWAPVSGAHWFGADRLGRDLFSLVLAGARTTLLVSLAATVVAAVTGTLLAAAAAVTPGWVRAAVGYGIDVLIAFPTLLLAMVLVAVHGASTLTAVLAIGLGEGFFVARVMRAEMTRVLAADYVLAARAGGAGTWRILYAHVLPNALPTLTVLLSLVMAIAVLAEAALSYLGYGVPSSTPTWGRMLHDLQTQLTIRPQVLVWPGLAIVATVLGFNLLGDGLRDAGDPKARRT
ncbi:peptide ABC transporter permease [Microtetraspora sp. NBRC 13810]|uniref:ABC transporter permease n=1 Tax=Microtetraspora sp. NBRC 13810 TaxID=3030990 RepID=UPI0024A41F66|nr:ABC transporter permease [Microtetraspora sp. NBRC 13810]GLW10987.1 peptide ABC transporter permease [Microtetraspora sp. NBRC 13810]